MVQKILSAFLDSLRAIGLTGMRLAPALAMFAAAVVVGLVLLWAADRERFTARLADGKLGKNVGGWLAFAFVSAILWLTLPKVGPIVRQERATQLESSYSSREDPSVNGVMQYGPLAAYVQEKTYSRTLTLPPDFLSRIGSEGVQVLSPYITDPSADNVLKLADTFRRSGSNVVFTRDVTKLDETPVTITKADVNVKLNFHDPGSVARKSFYDADFDASYTFSNPLSEPVDGRFVFPLPDEGTIRDFSLKVNGESVDQPDDNDKYTWNGKLDPGQSVTAVVHYRTQGGGSWKYEVGTGRRRNAAFTLRVTSNETPRFLRGALYPSRREGNTMVWELSNVITNRQVDLFFAGRGAAADAESKAFAYLPFGLAGFLSVFLLLLRSRGESVDPTALLLGTIGFALGLLALPVLLLYVGLPFAVLASTAIGSFLAFRQLGRGVLPPAIGALAIPLVFVSDMHSGLLFLILLAVGLGWVGRRRTAP